MIDTKNCDWLLENADAPIRYRVTRELLNDEEAAKKIEPELLDNPTVKLWVSNIRPEWTTHGCNDSYLENSVPKSIQLGLHCGIPQVNNAIKHYVDNFKNDCCEMPHRKNFAGILNSNLVSMIGISDELVLKFMINSLDEMYNFTKQGIYDIYISDEEKSKLKGIPPRWKNNKFIKPEILSEYGFGYPLIYDILGLYILYDLKDSEITKKIDNVIAYISADEFHSKIADGYGILIAGQYDSGNYKYHGMGWDPKYPGWFDIADYIENINAPRLLFLTLYFSKYPVARKTDWFKNLLLYLEKYITENNTYIFSKEWIKEKPGYAVQGSHLSFGENRKKKNWFEIESTFYMQLLKQNI